jgi:hypothetical protein
MNLNPLVIDDKQFFRKFLSLRPHELSVFTFENMYPWTSLYQIRWALIQESLCIFFSDSVGSFMYLPVLASQLFPDVVSEAFDALDMLNSHKEVSRIENIEAHEYAEYVSLGYECIPKEPEYICERDDLVRLRGNPFKSKRASCNYFSSHYDFTYAPYTSQDKDACIALYQGWQKSRRAHNADSVYQGMLQDSFSCLKVLLGAYDALDYKGAVVRVGQEVKAFTLGFPINASTFCIVYEVGDLAIKGISQYIFRSFCEELSGYKYINIMDDSGLHNLKKVKLSYHPVKSSAAYSARRKWR